RELFPERRSGAARWALRRSPPASLCRGDRYELPAVHSLASRQRRPGRAARGGLAHHCRARGGLRRFCSPLADVPADVRHRSVCRATDHAAWQWVSLTATPIGPATVSARSPSARSRTSSVPSTRSASGLATVSARQIRRRPTLSWCSAGRRRVLRAATVHSVGGRLCCVSADAARHPVSLT